MSLPFTDLYTFLRGPGFIISIIVFITGCIYHTFIMIRATRRINVNIKASPDIFPARSTTFRLHILNSFRLPCKGIIKISISRNNTLTGITSLVFHLLIFITPLFLSAHNIIADLTEGISLFTFPEKLTDYFTVLLIITGIFFLSRRIFIPRIRAISTFRDYLMLFIIMAPFISGYMAYHHFFNYRIVIYTHMISGELAFIIAPFTSLVHMPFVIFSRFFIDSEYSIMPGNRSW